MLPFDLCAWYIHAHDTHTQNHIPDVDNDSSVTESDSTHPPQSLSRSLKVCWLLSVFTISAHHFQNCTANGNDNSSVTESDSTQSEYPVQDTSSNEIGSPDNEVDAIDSQNVTYSQFLYG